MNAWHEAPSRESEGIGAPVLAFDRLLTTGVGMKKAQRANR